MRALLVVDTGLVLVQIQVLSRSLIPRPTLQGPRQPGSTRFVGTLCSHRFWSFAKSTRTFFVFVFVNQWYKILFVFLGVYPSPPLLSFILGPLVLVGGEENGLWNPFGRTDPKTGFARDSGHERTFSKLQKEIQVPWNLPKQKDFYILINGFFNQNRLSLRSNVLSGFGHKWRRHLMTRWRWRRK